MKILLALAVAAGLGAFAFETRAAYAAKQDAYAQLKPFTAELSGAKEIDGAWRSVSGGEQKIELTETTAGSGNSHVTTPGHKYVDEVTLRGCYSRNWLLLPWFLRDFVLPEKGRTTNRGCIGMTAL